MSEPVRVLVVVSDPAAEVSGRRLSVGLDYKTIEQQVQASSYQDLIKVDALIEPTAAELMHRLIATSPHVVHFACHGSPTGIRLRSSANQWNPTELPKEVLRDFLAGTGSVRLVVCNSCDTRGVGEALSDTVDFVVAMSDEISDGAATVFASSFYFGLASGLSVNLAFEMGRRRIGLENLNESHIPALLVREQCKAQADEAFVTAIDRAEERPRTSPLTLVPPDGMGTEHGYRYSVMEICEGRHWPDDDDILNHPVEFETDDGRLVAHVLNARLGLQYKCLVDLPEHAPSDEELTRRFEEHGWSDPQRDGQVFEHPSRRWFLSGNADLRCTSAEGYVNDFRPFSP